MKKRKSRKSRDRSPLPSDLSLHAGDDKHIYRVIVEKVLVQSVLVGAASQDDAESRAYEVASRVPRKSPLWREEEAQVRDCTSVQLADGTWKFCNALRSDQIPVDTENGDMV